MAASSGKRVHMRLTGFVVALLFVPAIIGRAGATPPPPQVGDTYEITRTSDSSQEDNRQSSGTTHDKDTIIERVLAVRPDGLDLEYDLPQGDPAEDKTDNWQFPARVFKPVRGLAQLLNGPELEARVDRWLRAAKWPRTVCGHWIFTWNAFRIECDPQSVLKAIEAFDLSSVDLREGASYKDPYASKPGTLSMKTAGLDGATFVVEMPIDPDAIRHGRAEADVAAGEIMNKPVTLDAALSKRAAETVSGTISLAFETDSTGSLRRRTKVIKLNIEGPDGRSEAQTITETLERRLISRGD